MTQTDDEEELQEAAAVPSGSEADPFSDGDALDPEEEDGEDLHEEGAAVPMGCAARGCAGAHGFRARACADAPRRRADACMRVQRLRADAAPGPVCAQRAGQRV